MGLLPSKPDLSADSEAGPRVVGVDSEDADALMSALTSQTARRLLSTLHEEPAPPSKLADQVDTSLQNVQYHLERLEDAGAVEVVGTAYSEKGREMDLYAPAAEPLVIYAGREEEASGLRAALSRLVSGIVALAVGAVAVQEVFGDGLPFPVARTGSGGDAGGAGGGGGGGGAGDASSGGGGGGSADGGETTGAGSAGGGGGAGDGGSAGTPEPTPASGGDGIGIAEAPTRTPTSTAESGSGTATPAPTGATETLAGTPAPNGQPTGTPTSVATKTPVAEGTPSPMATEAATPVPTGTATPVPTVEPTPVATATDVATEAVRTVASAGGAPDPATLPPGLVFFLGGAVVLVAGVALMYGR